MLRMVRRQATEADEVEWDPRGGAVDTAALKGVSAVVHLAGENIGPSMDVGAGGAIPDAIRLAARTMGARWTRERRQRIRESRVQGTGTLSRALAGMASPPAVLVSVSGASFYGSSGDEPLDESSPPGSGFLAEVCQAWEAAADPAREAGIRVVHPRIGMVLAREGGALPAMLPPFKLGMGGPIGSGEQYQSWIALDDVVRIIQYLVEREHLEGPVNTVAPGAVRNREFTRTLGRVLNRPAAVPLPAPVVSTLFGEMGRSTLLEGQRVVPARLTESGFEFRFPELEGALRHELER